MHKRLNDIQDWLELAELAVWNVTALAGKCRVSERTLERWFQKHKRQTPKKWLIEQRQLRAKALLRNGNSVKETAGILAYEYPTHFSRAYKQYWGLLPTKNHVNGNGV